MDRFPNSRIRCRTRWQGQKSLRTLTDVAVWVKGEAAFKLVVARRTSVPQKAIGEAELGQTTISLRSAAWSFNGAASQLGGRGGQLEETLVALRETLEAVRTLAARLERDPSALVRGRAVADPKSK